MKFRAVKLSGGRFEVVPDALVLLNPDAEGKRAFVWGVWCCEADRPCDQVGACEGRAVGPVMGYLSDRDDLWKLPQHGLGAFEADGDALECGSQVAELQRLALAELTGRGLLAGGPYVMAWAAFDMWHADRPTRAGVGVPFQRRA